MFLCVCLISEGFGKPLIQEFIRLGSSLICETF